MDNPATKRGNNMENKQQMNDEQRRAMFARLHGHSGPNSSAAARNPYTPEPVSKWDVFKGGVEGFGIGMAEGVGNLIDSGTFGLSRALGWTDSLHEFYGPDRDPVSEIASEICIMAASWAISGAGKAVEKTGGTLGKRALAEHAAKKAAAQEAAKKAAQESAKKAAEESGGIWRRLGQAWKDQMELGWGSRAKPPTSNVAPEYQRAKKAADWTAYWKDQLGNQFNRRPQFTHPEAPVTTIQRAEITAPAVRGAVAGAGAVHGTIAYDKSQDLQRQRRAEAEARAEEEYNRRARQIIYGTD